MQKQQPPPLQPDQLLNGGPGQTGAVIQKNRINQVQSNPVVIKKSVVSTTQKLRAPFSVSSLLNDNNKVIGGNQAINSQMLSTVNGINGNTPQQKEPALSVMSLLNDKKPMQAPVARVSAAAVAIRRPRTPQQPLTKPQAPLPESVVVNGLDGGDAWSLRCFCDIKAELGLMVQCERCLNWQHAACLNMTATTTPTNYTCPICANKFIRCQCGENMNYRMPLIKCSKCGYWVHRKCEGLDPGPYFTNNHVCLTCGGTPNQPPDVHLPPFMPYQDTVITISQDVIDELHPSVLSAPFAPLLTEEFFNHDVSAFKFCESVYNKYRAFFYLTHPTLTFYQPKKRRGDVSFSFFKAVFYILDALFGMTQDVAVQIFNTLAITDVYLPHQMPQTLILNKKEGPEFTDPAKAEFEKTKHTPELSNFTLPTDLIIKNGGIYCQSALQQEQLIGFATGLLGLIDEFSYDNGADSHFYSVCGTKFVLDARKYGPQLIHNFRRSLCPNCVLKLFKTAGGVFAGIFAGVSDVNGISRRTRREKFALPADVELTLPIDFAPATIEEPIDFMNWHFDDIDLPTAEPPSSPPPQISSSSSSASSKNNQREEPPKHASRPSREERDGAAAIRQLERKKKRKQKEEKIKNKRKIADNKRARGYSVRHTPEIPEFSLFSMIRQETPDQFLFELQPTEEEENEMDAEEVIFNDKDIFNGEVDTGFLDHLMNAEIRPFIPIKLENPINEMCQFINLKGFE